MLLRIVGLILCITDHKTIASCIWLTDVTTITVAWAAKCQKRRAGGPPASELKTLKIYISANFNYLKIFIVFSLLMETLNVFCHSSNR
jgi:hypothetical protein